MAERSLDTSREVTCRFWGLQRRVWCRQDQEEEDMTPTALQVAKFDVLSAANVVL